MTLRRRAVGLTTAAAITAILLSVAGAAVVRQQDADRLMTTEADRVLDDPALVRIGVRRARVPYRDHCASCHGSAMQGNPLIGAPNLTDHDWLYGEGRVGDVEQTILHGIRAGVPKTRDNADMPGFGKAQPYARYAIPPLSPQDITDVVSYLAAARGRAEGADAVARGRKIYMQDGGCFDCHGEDLRGDPAIGAPNLIDAIELYGNGSDDALARSIAEGRAGVCPGWAGRLDAVTIRALAVMVSARAHEKG